MTTIQIERVEAMQLALDTLRASFERDFGTALRSPEQRIVLKAITEANEALEIGRMTLITQAYDEGSFQLRDYN